VGFHLSILDSGSPRHLTTLIAHADALGYHRYWATEHHVKNQSASPLAAAAVALGTSRRIAVGTAGVMVRYCNPLRLAKDALLLELVFPNRVDVGTINGVARNSEVHALLSAQAAPFGTHEEFFVRLKDYLRSTESVDQNSLCRGATSPRLWMCSNSPASAICAARQSAGLVFHLPLAGDSASQKAAEVLGLYRASFEPSAWMASPATVIVCFGICTETDDDATATWSTTLERVTESERYMIADDCGVPRSTFFFGTPNACRDQLDSLACALSADEIAVNCAALNPDARLRALALLAESCGLAAAPSADPSWGIVSDGASVSGASQRA